MTMTCGKSFQQPARTHERPTGVETGRPSFALPACVPAALTNPTPHQGKAVSMRLLVHLTSDQSDPSKIENSW